MIAAQEVPVDANRRLFPDALLDTGSLRRCFAAMHSDFASLRAVVFDLDNTLYHRDQAVNSWVHATFPDREMAEAAIRYDSSGYIPRPDFYQWIVERVNWASDWKDVERRYQAEIFDHIQLDEDVLEAVHRIAETFPLGLLTNGNGPFQLKKFEATGITDLFRPECVFATGNIGHHKPDLRAFTPVIDAFQLAPEAILYVGDNAVNDVGGARTAGMRSCWIQLTPQHEDLGHVADWTVNSVAEMPALMEL